MTVELKLEQLGESVGAVFPKEALALLNAKAGETLYLTPSPRGFHIEAKDHDFNEAMKAAEEVMDEYREALRELAK